MMIKNDVRCPICGNYLLETNKIESKYYLSCLHCKSISPLAASIDEALEAWITGRNRRRKNDKH